MKALLGFLGRFLLYSALFGVIWWCLLAPAQVAVLAWTTGQLPMFAHGHPGISLSGKGTTINAVVAGKAEKAKSIAGQTLCLNVIPLCSLLLAVPGVSWRRRLWMLPLGLFLLHLEQMLHLTIDLYYGFPEELIHGGLQARGLKLKLVELAWTFFEQAGSMLTPFVIWLLLVQDVVFRRGTKAAAKS